MLLETLTVAVKSDGGGMVGMFDQFTPSLILVGNVSASFETQTNMLESCRMPLRVSRYQAAER